MNLSCRRSFFVFAVFISLVAAQEAAAQRGIKNDIFDARSLAPFVPTPQALVEHMLRLAEVTKKDVVYDLGSGDGRILFTAAQEFGAEAVGIEINSRLVATTRDRVQSFGLAKSISVRQQDMLEADLSPATVVTVYLLTSSNEQLKPKLEQELREGARVVSHDFQFQGWVPAETLELKVGSRPHYLYLYRIGQHR